MDFDLSTGIAVLERTPATLRAMLAGLPPAWIDATEGPDTWSPFDNVGHLIHGERTDWIPRARIILAQGADRRFTPPANGRQFIATWKPSRSIVQFNVRLCSARQARSSIV